MDSKSGLTGITTVYSDNIVIIECDFINNYSYEGGSKY